MKNEIIEMAEEIYRAGVALDGSDFAHKSDHFERLAGKLYKAGYRKQSETVKEFAEKALALCCKHHYSIATLNNQQGMGMFTEGFEQVLSETAADLAEQYGKEDNMAQWNFNCPDCIYYKPLETCPFTACQFTPVQIVTTNKTQAEQEEQNA